MSPSKKAQFQLINMSFSQEGSLKQQTEPERRGKNPHNTLTEAESEMIATYQEYEDMIEGRSIGTADQFTDASKLSKFKMIIADQAKAQENSVKAEVAHKIFMDADYRKQLLLRVLPKFEKLE